MLRLEKLIYNIYKYYILFFCRIRRQKLKIVISYSYMHNYFKYVIIIYKLNKIEVSKI